LSSESCDGQKKIWHEYCRDPRGIREQLEAAADLLARLALAIRGAGAVAALAGLLVLAGAIAAGARRYAALCAGCHLAPGVTKSDIRAGLYPHPPNLAQKEMQPAQRAFWIVKHGIKMSAMPAWGKMLDDAEIWEIVAFVRKMPAMTPEIYQELSHPYVE